MEKKALYASVTANGSLGILGFIFFFLTDSEAVLLDGAFNIISLVMGLLSLKVVHLLSIPDDSRYHFGYIMYEPLLNTIKGLIITFVCLLSIISAVDALIEGGKPLNFGFGLIYVAFAITGAFTVYFYQKRKARQVNSPLLEVEAKNWFINGVLSGVVGIAFLISFFVTGTSIEYITPYVDPVLILILVTLALKVPLLTIKGNVNQLMKQAPNESIQKEVAEIVDSAFTDLPISNRFVRMVQIGRVFYVLLQIVIKQNSEFKVEEEDNFRETIFEKLKEYNPDIVLDVVFTADEKWIK